MPVRITIFYFLFGIIYILKIVENTLCGFSTFELQSEKRIAGNRKQAFALVRKLFVKPLSSKLEFKIFIWQAIVKVGCFYS